MPVEAMLISIPIVIAAVITVHLWWTRDDQTIELTLEEAKVRFVTMARSASREAVYYAKKGMPFASAQSAKVRNTYMAKARWANAELDKAVASRTKG